MEISIQRIDLLLEVTAEVQERFNGFDDLAHGWEHVQRVYHLALYLAERCENDLQSGKVIAIRPAPGEHHSA